MDVKSQFEAAAIARGYKFLYGNRASINYGMKLKGILADEYMLIMYPCKGRALLEDGIWSRYEFTTVLELCKKSEAVGTRASLSETDEDKYTNRLQAMADEARDFMWYLFGCNAKTMELKSFDFLEMINQYSEGADSIQISITFELWE
jgi:hypothetical protein